MTDPKPSTQEAKLAGKVAIVTGGASGIGEATAHLFAAYSARAVVIADIQDEKGRGVAEAIGLNRSVYIHCDVSDEHEVEALVKSTLGIYGRIDVMFSNAGILSRSLQNVLDLDMGSMDRVFAVNTRGAAACVKHAGRAMVEGGVRGSIVCTASIAATQPTDCHVDYTMSKHALLGLVKSASLELGAYGIRVNSVSPSHVVTPLTREFSRIGDDEVAERVFEEYMSLKGVSCKMRGVTEAVAFLASDESELITGHDLVVDGGFRRPRYKEQSQKLP